MLRVFHRPIECEARTTICRQSLHKRRSMSARQLLSAETRIMGQAEKTFAGGFKVVKESSQSGLTASADAQECEHEITDGFLLMPVCARQNKTDILAEASGKRVLVHRRNNALTRGKLVTTRLLFQMCPDFRFG